MEEIENREEKKTTGMVYITDNDNMFLAPDGISKEEQNRLSLEVDRDVLMEKLAKIEEELKALPTQEHKEEIERAAPYETQTVAPENEEPDNSVDETEIPDVEAESLEIEPVETTISDATTLPDFTVQTKDGPKLFKNMKVVFQDEETNRFYLDNGKEKLILPAMTFKSIVSPESLHPQPEAFKDAEIAEESPAAVLGKTTLPEFSMITTKGIEVFKDLTVQKFNPAENSYTLSNGDTSLTVTAETFKEINKPERYEKVFNENTPAYEKLIDSQYEAYFKQRDNTADNFIHNLSVYCRKEANSPLDALTISKEIISRMDKEEKEKTRLILKQMAREEETINQVLINTYYEAIKGVPLDRETILQKKSEERIAKPFSDTISTNGALVDKDSKLKIGDTIKDMAFNIPKAFGTGKDRIFEDLTVISASKDGNNIILMDKNRSFYELPRDKVLEGYNKQQEKQHKAEMKQKRSNRIDVGWER